MAGARQLPCNSDGVCLQCKTTPSEFEKLLCIICHVLWHASCLMVPSESLTEVYWKCPDCVSDTAGASTEGTSVGENTELVGAIREIEEDPRTKVSKLRDQPKTSNCLANRPDTAFITERAKRAGLANASSGRIFVTAPSDHFGPIGAEFDPEDNRGVLVGDIWNSRMEARQWGVHLAPVSGISGQSKIGAQSVVLSGGYKDDKDYGIWFIYTGSGGRDITGNKRTNKTQSSDQDYVKCNEALRVSCMKGYPVRVVRAYKYKRSNFAPVEGYRYDGIYRIERCWRIAGSEGFLICQYLFVRCDNKPAPWTSDRCGDMPRHLGYIPGYHEAVDVIEREDDESPSWDFDHVDYCWKWMKPPPPSKAVTTSGGNSKNRKRRRKNELESEHGLVDLIEMLHHRRETNDGTSDSSDTETMEEGDAGSDDEETI